MTPAMRQILQLYGDMITIDSTYKKNSLNMPLVAVVVVDREGKIRLGAAALVERETSEDFSWFLNWMVTNSSWYP